MADDVKMEPVDQTPVAGAEPPAAAANPLAKPTATATLRPGLKLPPKPGATVALKPGLKLPPKPGATVALKPGLKLPPKPGATVALKPGLRLPPKPVIHKPGATIAAKPLPKPVEAPKVEAPVAEAPKPVEAPKVEAPKVEAPVAEAPKPVEAPKVEAPVAEAPKPVEAPKPILKMPPKPVIRKPGSTVAAKPLPKPISVDAQGVGRLPTVDAKAVSRDDAQAPLPEPPKAMDALKSMTQKLKGTTQNIPQQAVLHKTGIIADGVMTESQKEAAKHKTARISLSDAMGVAPVKNENAPMKTIRIKRPIDIPGATKPLMPQKRVAPGEAAADASTPPAEAVSDLSAAEAPAPEAQPSATITQRKTLKISRPGVVRPGGKFGIKRAGAAPAPKAAAEGEAPVADLPDVADIPEMPSTPYPPMPQPVQAASDGPMWLWVLSSLVQAAACVALGALAWFLYQNTQIAYF